MNIYGASGPSGSARFDSGSAGDAGFVKFEGEFVKFVTGQAGKSPEAHVTKHWLAQHPVSGFSEEQIKHLISAIVSQVGLENAKAAVEGFSEDEKTLCVRRLKVEGIKRDLQKDVWDTLERMKEEGLEHEADRIELAMAAAERDEGAISYSIHKFDISDQNALFEIAKKAAARNGGALSCNIKNYGIKDSKTRAVIAKIAAAQDGFGTTLNIKQYDITDQTDLAEIAKIAVNQNTKEVLLHIYHYDLKNAEALSDVILSLDTSNPAVLPYRSLLDEVKEYDYDVPPLENVIIGVVKISAAQFGASTSRNIKKYGITDQKALVDIAKIAAAQSGGGASAHIKNYGIKDQDALVEIAKIAAAQNGYDTSFSIKNYGIEDEAALVEIAKIAAAQNGLGTSQNIERYGIKDPEALEEIFLCALASDIASVAYVNNFDPGVNINCYIPPNTPENLREDVFAVRFVLDHLLGYGEDKPLTQSLLKLRNPAAKKRALQLIGSYTRELKETTLNEPLDIVRTLMKKLKGVEIKIESGPGKDKFTPRELKDEKLQQQLLITSYELLTANNLNTNDVENLLKLVTGSSSKIQALQKISAIIALDRVDLLKDTKSLDKSLEETFNAFLDVEGIEGFSQKFSETFGEFRDPQALFIYAGQINKLPEPERTAVLADLRIYIEDVLNSVFQFKRAEGLDSNWVAGAKKQVSFGSKAYTLLDSDDPCDFLMMGTEAESCQKVDGEPDQNKGLVGTMLDGRNRLLLLKDQSGKIGARSLLRLVKEGDKPALLLEPIYPHTLSDAEKQALFMFAKERSQTLGWPLYGVKVEFEGIMTAVTLTSENGRGAFQYIDSVGGNMPQGAFTVENPKLLGME